MQSRTFEFQFSVARTHPALPGHFPGRPIVPGVLLLDRVLTGVATELNRPVTFLRKVKFAASLLPDETVTVACEATDDRLRFSVCSRRAGVLVTLASGSGQLALQTLPPVATTIPASGSVLG